MSHSLANPAEAQQGIISSTLKEPFSIHERESKQPMIYN